MLGRNKIAQIHSDIVSGIEVLTENQSRMVAAVVRALQIPIDFFRAPHSDLVDQEFSEVFGNFLLLHHALHEEPFSKKPFEYLLKQCLIAQGHQAELNQSPGGNSYDVEGGGYRWSLKTEAARGISRTQVKIEKFMEARWIRDCTTPELCAQEVKIRLNAHMKSYDRILILRAFVQEDSTSYTLEEIPKAILIRAFSQARSELFQKNKNSPSFGANFFDEHTKTKLFRLLLDSSVEKIRLWYQVGHCMNHGKWVIPRLDDGAMRLF